MLKMPEGRIRVDYRAALLYREHLCNAATTAFRCPAILIGRTEAQFAYFLPDLD
jgi:hypothetical protein